MKVVHVKWIDSASAAGGPWSRYDSKFFGPVQCESLGFLIKDEKEFITVAAHIDPENRNASGDLSIPRVAILSIKEIVHEDTDKIHDHQS